MEPGKLQYTSVVKEFSDVGVDFKKVIQDSELLENEISVAKSNWENAEEKLKAAKICYDTMQNEESRKMYAAIMRETLLVRHKLAILRIAELVSKKTHDYVSAKGKRENILRLINYRLTCLEQLGVKFSIDPFGRIKLDNQLEVISSFENNNEAIAEIRKRIQILSSQIDEMKNRNIEFLNSINDDYNIIRLEAVPVAQEISQLDLDNLYNEDAIIQSNQVTGVKDTTTGFKLSVSREKASAVVRRVYDMFSKPKAEPVSEVTPLLVIEEEPNDEVENTKMVSTSKDVTPQDVFLEVPSIIISSTDKADTETLSVQEKSNPKLTDGSLFEEVTEPFESAPLFDDRKDDAVFNEKPKNSRVNSVVISPAALDKIKGIQTQEQNETTSQVADTNDTQSLEDTMPEVFWMTQEDQSNSEDDEKVLSLDEQVEALFKTRKKVA